MKEMRKVVAIDWDGVLVDSQSMLLSLFNEKNGTNHKLEDMDGWNMEDKLGISNDELLEWFELAWSNPYLSPTESGIGRVVKDIRDKGYRISILTKRTKGSIPDTYTWLMHNNIPFDDFIGIYDGRKKHEFPFDVLIDDHPLNIEGLPDDRLGFLFNRPWNRTSKHPFRINKLSDLLTLGVL